MQASETLSAAEVKAISDSVDISPYLTEATVESDALLNFWNPDIYTWQQLNTAIRFYRDRIPPHNPNNRTKKGICQALNYPRGNCPCLPQPLLDKLASSDLRYKPQPADLVFGADSERRFDEYSYSEHDKEVERERAKLLSQLASPQCYDADDGDDPQGHSEPIPNAEDIAELQKQAELSDSSDMVESNDLLLDRDVEDETESKSDASALEHNWSLVAEPLYTAYLLRQCPSTNKCYRCHKPSSVFCKDCATYFCFVCDQDIHEGIATGSLHLKDIWTSPDAPSVTGHVQSTLSLKCLCQAAPVTEFTTTTLRLYTLSSVCTTQVSFHKAHHLTDLLVFNGFWPSRPLEPTIAFSLQFMQHIFLQLTKSKNSLESSFAVFRAVYSDSKCTSVTSDVLSADYRKLLDCYVQYAAMMGRDRGASFLLCGRCLQPGCVVCGRKPVNTALDAVLGLKLFEHARRDPQQTTTDKQSVDEKQQFPLGIVADRVEQRDATAKLDAVIRGAADTPDECSRQFQAVENAYKRKQRVVVNGVLHADCRHGCVLKLTTLPGGERYSSGIYLLLLLLRDGYQLQRLTYDIACKFKVCIRNLLESGLFDGSSDLFTDIAKEKLASLPMFTPAFHAHGHNAACNLSNNIAYQAGVGLTCGEEVESVNSILLYLTGMLRTMSINRFEAILEIFCGALNDDKNHRMALFLFKRLLAVLKELSEKELALYKLLKHANATEADASAWFTSSQRTVVALEQLSKKQRKKDDELSTTILRLQLRLLTLSSQYYFARVIRNSQRDLYTAKRSGRVVENIASDMKGTLTRYTDLRMTCPPDIAASMPAYTHEQLQDKAWFETESRALMDRIAASQPPSDPSIPAPTHPMLDMATRHPIVVVHQRVLRLREERDLIGLELQQLMSSLRADAALLQQLLAAPPHIPPLPSFAQHCTLLTGSPEHRSAALAPAMRCRLREALKAVQHRISEADGVIALRSVRSFFARADYVLISQPHRFVYKNEFDGSADTLKVSVFPPSLSVGGDRN